MFCNQLPVFSWHMIYDTPLTSDYKNENDDDDNN